MAVIHKIREAYTFDDVLLKPGLSDILPSDADIRSFATRAIPLNIPIIASAASCRKGRGAEPLSSGPARDRRSSPGRWRTTGRDLSRARW